MNQLVVDYLMLDEVGKRSLHYGLAVLGAIIAGVSFKPDFEMTRAPYFVASAMLLLAAVSTNIPWLYEEQLIVAGNVGLLVGLDVIGSIVFGAVAGHIAMARSLDAYGHRMKAAYAFIPFANLILLLRASKRPTTLSASQARPWGLVAAGFVCLFLAAFANASITATVQRQAREIDNDPERYFQVAYGLGGVESIWRQIATATQVPERLDTYTVLIGVEVSGSTLTYRYQLAEGATSVSPTFPSVVQTRFCGAPIFRNAISRGGMIEMRYYDAAGAFVYGFDVESC